MVLRPGPVFCSVLLADEINRATPRTQSALLECMGEGQDYDICEFYIDGELQFSHDEDISGWQPYVFLVSPGKLLNNWKF